MCSPNAAIITGSILQGTSGFLQAQQDAQTLKGQARVAETNAKIKDMQADEEKLTGAKRATQLRVATSRAVSQQATATAGAGIDVGGQTAQEVILSTEQVGVADILEDARNTKKRVWGLQVEAAGLRTQAKSLKKAAKRTQLLAPISAVAPIITGFGTAKLAKARGSQA